MKKKEAETYARNHLASKLELFSVSPPLSIGLRNETLADDCYWFDFRFQTNVGSEEDGLLVYEKLTAL